MSDELDQHTMQCCVVTSKIGLDEIALSIGTTRDIADARHLFQHLHSFCGAIQHANLQLTPTIQAARDLINVTGDNEASTLYNGNIGRDTEKIRHGASPAINGRGRLADLLTIKPDLASCRGDQRGQNA